LLVNGVLIAALFAVLVVGDKLGGKWALLFPGFLVGLLVAILLYRRRRGWSQADSPSSSRTAGRAILLVTAIATGLLLGGPTLALMAGLGSAAGLLIVVGIRRAH